jgi:hypothetical protein
VLLARRFRAGVYVRHVPILAVPGRRVLGLSQSSRSTTTSTHRDRTGALSFYESREQACDRNELDVARDECRWYRLTSHE